MLSVVESETSLILSSVKSRNWYGVFSVFINQPELRDVVKWTTPKWTFKGMALKRFTPGPDDQNPLPSCSGTPPLRDAHAELSINVPRAQASTSARLPRPVRSTLRSPFDNMDKIERIVDGVNGEFRTLQTEVRAARRVEVDP